ncbi:MAG: tetratricopeptide repeat protein [Candidatus Zixiibacteriota bacterium]
MTDRNDSASHQDHYWAALVALLIWLAVVASAAFFPHQRLWGLNHLAFVGPTVRWAFAGAAIAAIMLVLLPRVLPHKSWASGRWLSDWRGGVALAIAVGVLASLLHAREAFLGDGTLRADGASEGAALAPSEMLPTFLTATLVRYAPSAWAIDGYDAYRIISIVFAVLLTLGLWWLVPKTGTDGRSPVFWLLTFGSVRLMAGYIESYMPVFTALTLWALAAWAYRRGRLAAGWVMAFWVVAMVSHIMAVVLIPATLWLFAVGPRGRPGRQRASLTTFFVIALIVAGTVLGIFLKYEVAGLGVKGTHFVLPPFSKAPHQYGLFSLPHLLDFVNHWLLLAPAFLAAIGVVVATAGLGWLSPATSLRRGALWSSDLLLWCLTAGVPLAAAIVLEPQLGWGRDWDLFCVLSAPALVGMALWLAGNVKGALRRSAAAIAILSTGLWLVFSVDANAERRRFEALLDLDPTRAGYGHEIMAHYYRRRNDYQSALEHYQKALFAGENQRYRMSVAVCYYYMGKFDQSELWYRGVVARDSAMAPAWHGLSLALQRQGRFGEARDCALRALAIQPNEIDFQYQVGVINLELGDWQAALPYLEPLARLQPRRANHLNGLGLCYLGLKRLPEAEAVLSEALRLEPGNAVVILNLARVAVARQNYTAARSFLSRYEQLTPPGGRHPEARLLADSLARVGA